MRKKAEVDVDQRLMLRLLRAGRALATHDVRLIRHAIEVAKAEGIPAASKFQEPLTAFGV